MTEARASLRRAFRNSRVRLVTLLALAMLVPVAALVYAQIVTLAALDSTTADVLAAVSQHTADVIASQAARDFAQPSFEVERVDHSALERFDLGRVAEGLVAVRRASLVDVYYVWSGSPAAVPSNTVLEVSPGALAGTTDPAGAFRSSGAVGLRLRERASRVAGRRVLWDSWRETLGDRPYVFVLHVLFESPARERMTSFIGFRIDVESLRARYLPPLVDAALRQPRPASGLATLAASVLDAEGRTFFESSPAARPPWVTEQAIPLRFFDPDIMRTAGQCDECPGEWRLMMSYGGKSVAQIARERSHQQRLLLAALVAFAGLGLGLAVWSAVVQVKLADAKAQFVASVSHDLKTPLSLVRLFAETLELGRVASPERATEYYRIINREAGKLAALIDGVLSFSKIEAGVRAFRFEPVDLGEAARAAVRRFHPWFEDARFTVAVEVAPVGNLLSNAINYSAESRNIEVRVWRRAGHVLVEVEDHGIGIARRFHKRIFKRYYRVREDPVASSVGTGLGLAIVEQVMAAHHGHVWVRSEPGQGSTFTLAFPVGKEQGARGKADSGDRGRAPDAAGAA
jgi:signal transduction histidine kinase